MFGQIYISFGPHSYMDKTATWFSGLLPVHMLIGEYKLVNDEVLSKSAKFSTESRWKAYQAYLNMIPVKLLLVIARQRT